MSEKKVSRIRRAKKTRSKLKSLGETRLTIHRTPRHIYAQVIAPEGDKVLAAASTVETVAYRSRFDRYTWMVAST